MSPKNKSQSEELLTKKQLYYKRFEDHLAVRRATYAKNHEKRRTDFRAAQLEKGL